MKQSEAVVSNMYFITICYFQNLQYFCLSFFYIWLVGKGKSKFLFSLYRETVQCNYNLLHILCGAKEKQNVYPTKQNYDIMLGNST